MSQPPPRHGDHRLTRTSKLVRVYRLSRLCLHLIHGCLAVGVVFPFLTAKRRFRMIQSWSRTLLRILHVHYTVRGHLPAVGPTLLVANHVSWLDIWVINAVVAVRFVAKAEIRRWPVIGFLVKGAGTIFVEREKRHDTARTNRSIVQALTRGEYVAVFPEGTTTDGTELKPYHASLFQPAVGAGASVTVIALRYIHRNGELNDDASYAGERSLVESARRILRHPALHADVIFAGEVSVNGKTRREIAIEAELTTARALALVPPRRKPGTRGGHPDAERKAAAPIDTPNRARPRRAATSGPTPTSGRR
jgi:1-acyl-sn-glycerol-3-phosphate acyltransferase